MLRPLEKMQNIVEKQVYVNALPASCANSSQDLRTNSEGCE